LDLFSLKNRIALITGSSQGLGLAIAEGLGRAGATVVLNGRGEEKLVRARRQLQDKGVMALGYCFDVADEQAVERAVGQIETEVGPIDCLVNNAGINLRGALEEFETERWKQLMAVNLDGVFHVSKAVGRRMIGRKRGKVINIASLMSERARATVTPYAASKGALLMFTKSLAVEWGPHNIQVNAIGPGYFKTEMTAPLLKDAAFDAWVHDKTPLRRWGEPDDLAGAAVFFASHASDFVTGQTLFIDGGWLAAV
jgi:gluconate 5-dehydrogenase